MNRAPFDPTAFDAVIFDCDGVIADSEPASVESWLDATRTHGLDIDEEEIGSFIGKTERDLATHYAPLAGVPIDTMEETARQSFLELVERKGLSPFPDAVAMIERVTALGIPFGVGSNSPRWRLNAVLTGTGVLPHIPFSVAGDEVARPKPAPDVYLSVVQRLGVDPGRIVVVEDTPTGIRAAKDAGCSVVAVFRGAVDRSALDGADLVVDGLWPE